MRLFRSFNRTIVELKRQNHEDYRNRGNTFNRTIVELKPCMQRRSARSQLPFNRTIVELKLTQMLNNVQHASF